MIALGNEVARLPRHATDERLRALKRIIPWTKVQSILKSGPRRRHCPRAPGWFMVWFVIALGLFGGDCYRQVYRWLQPYRRQGVPPRTTLCMARQRLGVTPLRRLLHQVVELLARPQTPGAFYQGLRLMALDGFLLDVPDTPANAIFGRPDGGRGAGAFPQARVVSLCELGTHVLWRSLIRTRHCGEPTMAGSLLPCLTADMLLLWDRNFFSYDHVAAVRRRGAHLLARLKKHLVLVPIRRLPDRSYLAKIYPSPHDRAKDRQGLLVRIIEYTFRDPGRPGAGERHRLLTTLLDWEAHPAKTLIVLYHRRWEEELAIDELKTHQRERPVLRSETPAGVVQEIYGLLLGHYVVRKLMFEAATGKALSPLRVSFTGALKILRCRLPECPKSRLGLRRWYEDLLAEIGDEIIPKRRDRVNPRVIKQKIKKWPRKRPKHREYPQPRRKIERSIVMLR